MYRLWRHLAALAFCLGALALLVGCGDSTETREPRTPSTTLDRGGPIELDGVQVEEYEGQDLSSVEDFRENSIEGPQSVAIEEYELRVTGLVDQEQAFAYDEVLDEFETYEKVVELHCVEGWDVTILWEGVLVRDLLDSAGAGPEANTVIMYAVDGYSSSLPLDFFYDNDILLAYGMNGVTLPPERGYPFQLVAEDKWGYKWVKWVEEIELSDDPDFEGYWESRGYSNEGDYGGPIFGD